MVAESSALLPSVKSSGGLSSPIAAPPAYGLSGDLHAFKGMPGKTGAPGEKSQPEFDDGGATGPTGPSNHVQVSDVELGLYDANLLRRGFCEAFWLRCFYVLYCAGGIYQIVISGLMQYQVIQPALLEQGLPPFLVVSGIFALILGLAGLLAPLRSWARLRASRANGGDVDQRNRRDCYIAYVIVVCIAHFISALVFGIMGAKRLWTYLPPQADLGVHILTEVALYIATFLSFAVVAIIVVALLWYCLSPAHDDVVLAAESIKKSVKR